MIIPTNLPYSYEMMMENLQELKRKFSILEIGSIGSSVLGKNLPYVRIGIGPKEVLYHAGIHANEWITSVLLMKFIEDFCEAYESNTSLKGFSARRLFYETSLYLVPMVNPDTINFVVGAISEGNSIYQNYQFLSKNFPQIPFPNGWKANFNGVDLNLQFPAGWKQAKEIKYSQGFTKPAPRDFVGEGPLTEPEALALYNFTVVHDFDLTISYHTQGEEIYWQFLSYAPQRAKQIGEEFARVSGYTLAEVPYTSSFAGYKDWFLQTYQRPSYTIEAGLRREPTSYFTI